MSKNKINYEELFKKNPYHEVVKLNFTKQDYTSNLTDNYLTDCLDYDRDIEYNLIQKHLKMTDKEFQNFKITQQEKFKKEVDLYNCAIELYNYILNEK